MTPAVSVIVPVFNVAPYLAECMDSLLAQTLDEVEIIVVDDCSTDGSRQMLAEYSRLPQVRVAYQEVNSGLAATRNLGLTLASGDFVGFVDSDDFVEPHMFARMNDTANAHNADVVGCSVTSHAPDGTTTLVPHPLPSDQVLNKACLGRLLTTSHVSRAYWYVPRFLYRRSFLGRYHIRFDPTIRLGEDTVFNAQVLNLADAAVIVPDALYHVRQRADSLTSTRGQPHQYEQLDRQYRAVKDFYLGQDLWDERRRDHHQYILSFQIPQALANARHLSTSRAEVRMWVERLVSTDWVAEALESEDAYSELGYKHRLVIRLMRLRWLALLTFIYTPARSS